jgi:hypothetical protein
MSSPRVEIDLNGADERGRSLVFLSDATGELKAGRMAVAFESEDGVCAPALVESVNVERGTAFLWVDWQSMTKESPMEAAVRMTQPVWEQTVSANATVSEVVGAERVNRNVASSRAIRQGPVRVVHLPSSV